MRIFCKIEIQTYQISCFPLATSPPWFPMIIHSSLDIVSPLFGCLNKECVEEVKDKSSKSGFMGYQSPDLDLQEP